MILLNSKKCNSFKEILEKYNNMINLPYLECPNCKSTNLIRWGSYKRNISYIDLIIKQETLTIQRVKCKKCGKTHALLPVFVVPYKINLLDVIIRGINEDVVTIKISYDTIAKWKKEFNKYLPYLKTIIKKRKNEEIIKIIKEKIIDVYEIYYKTFRKILMMNHLGKYNMAYF